MAALGLGIGFIGYSVMYFGLTQVQGQNLGFLDLVLPTRWAKLVTTPGPVNDDGHTYPLKGSAATSPTKGTPSLPVRQPPKNTGKIGQGSLPTPIK